MSGLYIHIPFCASRCIYCDFYSTTLRGRSRSYVDALLHELDERWDSFSSSRPDASTSSHLDDLTSSHPNVLTTFPLRTIYLGGGTPSQLSDTEMQRLFDGIGQRLDLTSVEEVTVEMNPDDVIGYHLPAAVNRVSLGVQTMVDEELRLINRRHDAQTVREAVAHLRQSGISNISLDLIYGLPSQTMESWRYSVEEILKLHPEHISAYNLQVEEETRLNTLVQRGELTVTDDETCIAMNNYLRQRLKEAGYEQYEISNYALPGYHSRHNSSYWECTPYLGLGPGAHSYDGKRRRSWNAPRVLDYMRGHRIEEHEELTDTDLYNERVMLGLRTRRGVNLALFPAEMQPTLQDLSRRGLIEVQPAQQDATQQGLIEIQQTHVRLTAQGLPLADEVIRELFL